MAAPSTILRWYIYFFSTFCSMSCLLAYLKLSPLKLQLMFEILHFAMASYMCGTSALWGLPLHCLCIIFGCFHPLYLFHFSSVNKLCYHRYTSWQDWLVYKTKGFVGAGNQILTYFTYYDNKLHLGKFWCSMPSWIFKSILRTLLLDLYMVMILQLTRMDMSMVQVL